MFHLIFCSVVALAVLSLATAVFLASIATPTESVIRLIDTCSTTWKMGFGAIVGLLGGKALNERST